MSELIITRNDLTIKITSPLDRGFIQSDSVTNILLYEILAKLEEIHRQCIDVEVAITDK